jgi:hypothetical protein
MNTRFKRLLKQCHSLSNEQLIGIIQSMDWLAMQNAAKYVLSTRQRED